MLKFYILMGPETYFSRTTEPSFRALGTHFPFELTRGISRKSRRSWKSRARRSAWREPHKNTRQKYLRNMTLYCNALEFIERIWFTSDEICLSADENAVSDMPVMKVSGLFFVGFHVVSASSVSQFGGAQCKLWLSPRSLGSQSQCWPARFSITWQFEKSAQKTKSPRFENE